MRADFKHKWEEETRWHHQTIMIKSAEIADREARNQLLTESLNKSKSDLQTAETEIASTRSQLEDARKQMGVMQAEIDKFAVGVTNIGRQLESQLAQIAAWEAEAKTQKERANAANNKAMTATQDLQYQRQESERLSKDLGSLEGQYQDLARDRQRLQETIAHLNAIGVRTDVVAPRKALAGQVTAAAAELDLVVISIGRDAGVNEGDEFTIYRANTFVCKITIDRVDRAWSSGRVSLKGKEEPRIGDQASNNVLATPGKSTN
jgi:chromosome segregation ATPase